MAGGNEKLVQEYQQKKKTAFVLGYTGGVGTEVVKALLSSQIFAKVVLIGRRAVTYDDELYRDVEQRVVDFDNLDKHADAFKNFDVGYCCLGARRRIAGAEGFYRVDHDYIVNAAQLARNGGCSQFHVVSGPEVDKNSPFLYLKTKGQTEADLETMGFESLIIYRPWFLLAKRHDVRIHETAIVFLLTPIIWLFPTFITVPVETVARAMLSKTLAPVTERIEVMQNEAIHLAGAN